MKMKKTTLAAAVSMLLSGAAFAAPPGVPTIGWGEYTFALVEIDQSQVAYEKLVVAVRDEVEINVTWDVWSGGDATTARVLMDGKTVWEGPAGPKSATFTMNKGGVYDMVVELENADGVSKSQPKVVTIADTDGSHLEPLITTWTENNKPYENKSGKIVGTYFVEWSVYGRDYPLDKVPLANLNRLIYGFIPICGNQMNDSVKTIEGSYQALVNACAGRKDFQVAIHDPWAAIQKGQKGVESWSSPYKGNFAQMMMAKQAYPDLKILPSIGGWTLSDPFFFMDNAADRKIFIDSVRDFLKTWKFFDGVDIDFENPGGGGANTAIPDPEKDGALYVNLIRELRAMLDDLGAEMGREYMLTSAIMIGEDKMIHTDYAEASKYLTNIFMMSYDFYGAFDTTYLNHQTALHESGVNPGNKYYASKGVEILLASGVPADKLVLGVAAYGRGWTGVVDYIEDNPFTGKASGPIKGTWENGVLDYRDIVDNHMGDGWEYGYDEQAEAPYVFNATARELVTYDDPRSVMAKAQYVLEKGLAGIFHWEMDGDNGDLINAMHEGLGHGSDNGGQPPANRAPQARAGADKAVSGPVELALNGANSSDPEGEQISFNWAQTGGPTVQVANNTTAEATINLPQVTAETAYTFTLTVTDPKGLTGSDSVVITNKPPIYNEAPTVDIPADTYVNEGKQVVVRVIAQDKDGDSLAYMWDVDPNLMVMGSGGAETITLKAPDVDSDTAYDIAVTVTDGEVEVIAKGKVHVVNVPDAPKPEPDGGNNSGDNNNGNNNAGSGSGSAGVTPGGDTGGCSGGDANAANYPAWDPAAVYTTETVSHNGLVYKAKWWVQGSEPSPSNEAWQLMSNVELPWDAAVAYQGNAQVNHNGSRWQAKWWTQGAEPGVDEVWVNVGPATCE